MTDAIICACEDCDWKGPRSEIRATLHRSDSADEWHDQGCLVPVGECPMCGAYAYEVDTLDAATLRYPVQDWEYEVANGDTRRGYADWVQACMERDGVDSFA